MALDINHYFKANLSKEDFKIFSENFGHYNFNSLFSASVFFKNIASSSDELKIPNQKDKNLIIEKSELVSEKLREQITPIGQLLESEIYPRMEISTLLSDLSPKVGISNIVLCCPSCGKKEAYIGNGGKGSVIICNRENKCGVNTTVISHIEKREGVGFYKAVELIADNAGVDLRELQKSFEYQKDMNEKDRGFLKKRANQIREIEVRNLIDEIDFDTLQEDKSYLKYDTSKHSFDFSKMNDTQKYQTALAYIRDFALRNGNRAKVQEYFKTRGLGFSQISKDVGLLEKKDMPTLVSNMKSLFGAEELAKIGVFSKNGNWKHFALDKKTDKIKYCDSIVFTMHTPYSDVPTNMEFRFIGKDAEGIKNKTSANSNKSLVSPNYYGDHYNVDIMKKSDVWWFSEGILDAKTLNALGYKANSLIGVHNHFDKKIGLFKNKVAVIAFDQDKAGIENTQKFAEKLHMAKAKQIIVATWDDKFGKDINDLLLSGNMDKIKYSPLEREEEVIGNIKTPIFKYSIAVKDIDKDSLSERLRLIKEKELTTKPHGTQSTLGLEGFLKR